MEGVLIKSPHKQEKYTEEQLVEFAACADPVTGPQYFLNNFFYIQHPTKGKMLYSPFDYQARLIDAYHNYRFSISMLPRQTGKALDITTPILTPNGFEELKDISIGDSIYGQDGKEAIVTSATDIMENHECYKIIFDNNDEIVADAEHLWTVSSSNWDGKEKTLTTKELIPFLTHTNKPYIKMTEPLHCFEKTLPVNPYLLGVWIGDGHTNGARVTTHIDDLPTYLENDIVENVNNKSESRPNVRNFRIKGGQKILTEAGLLGNKHIPAIYFTASYNQRLELLQGLMDTDGSIDKRNGRCEFYQKKLDIIKQVQTLLSTFGIKSRKKSKTINGELYWTIGFKTELPIFKLERKLKYIRPNRHPKNKRIYFYSIEKIDSVPVKCIQVNNENHLFLAGNSLIPTHNSTSAAGYLLWYAMFVPDSTILVAAHKYLGAQEIMQRIRYAYESCPDHIRAGATSYNKGSIEFDNGSRIVSQTTTENTGRGMSITLLYCLDGDTTKVKVRNKTTLIEEEITLAELYGRLTGAQHVVV